MPNNKISSRLINQTHPPFNNNNNNNNNHTPLKKKKKKKKIDYNERKSREEIYQQLILRLYESRGGGRREARILPLLRGLIPSWYAGGGGEKESGNFAKRKEKVNISWAGLKRFSSRPASSHLDPWSGEDGLLVRERELQCYHADIPWDRLPSPYTRPCSAFFRTDGGVG